tara:strand:- start:156 stop:1205 length:1050 start_codon:yes stop_codon:yes gene_type:complete
MSIALITGSSGLIGSEASTFFASKGFEVLGIDNNFRKFFFGSEGEVKTNRNRIINKVKRYKHFDIDIRNKIQLEKIFKKNKKKIEVIIHAAAQPSHDWAKNNINLDFQINAIGTLNLLNLTRKYCPDAVFIFTSTNKVYGDNPNKFKFYENLSRWDLKKNHENYNGINEKMSLDNCLHSFFGTSKVYADLVTQEFGKNFGLKTVCFRAGCITGPNHAGVELHGFISYMIKTFLNEKTYKIFGHKGKQVRDNLHSQDLINCFWEFFKKPKHGEVYNVGGGRKSNCSILEVINYLESNVHKKFKKKLFKKSRIGDHIWYISNMAKFKRDYPNWKQRYNIKKILDEQIDSLS